MKKSFTPLEITKSSKKYKNKENKSLTGFTIREIPKIERPREKLIAKGPQNLKDEELYHR